MELKQCWACQGLQGISLSNNLVGCMRLGWQQKMGPLPFSWPTRWFFDWTPPRFTNRRHRRTWTQGFRKKMLCWRKVNQHHVEFVPPLVSTRWLAPAVCKSIQCAWLACVCFTARTGIIALFLVFLTHETPLTLLNEPYAHQLTCTPHSPVCTRASVCADHKVKLAFILVNPWCAGFTQCVHQCALACTNTSACACVHMSAFIDFIPTLCKWRDVIQEYRSKHKQQPYVVLAA